MKKALVVGYGSIGKRHARNLSDLGFEVTVKTRHPDENIAYTFISKTEELSAFDLVVIASPTVNHCDDLEDCARRGVKKVLIEKPIEINLERALSCVRVCKTYGIDCQVAYNLRFHPFIAKLKNIVDSRLTDIRVVRISAGSYLPSWRPNSDYKKSYSARKSLGGGVHLDLSHEIDYMIWIFGMPLRIIHTSVDHISDLAIDSYDYFKGVFRYNHFIVDMDLDYFRKSERYIRVSGENADICRFDLIQGTYEPNGGGNHCVIEGDFNWNDMYIDELKDVFLPSSERRGCSCSEAVQTMEILSTL